MCSVAGILGYAVGKASYFRTSQKKFQELGIDVGPGFGPWCVRGRFGRRWVKRWIIQAARLLVKYLYNT